MRFFKYFFIAFCLLVFSLKGQWTYLGTPHMVQDPVMYCPGAYDRWGGNVISGIKSARIWTYRSSCSPSSVSAFFSECYSYDSCKTWNCSGGGAGYGYAAFSYGFWNDTIFNTFIAYGGAAFRRSTDGGETWSNSSVWTQFNTPQKISVYSGEYGYGYNTYDGQFYRIDHDTVFVIRDTGIPNRWDFFQFVSDSIGFAGLSDTLLRTTDGGVNWNSVLIDTNGTYQSITMVNDSVGFLFNYSVFQSDSNFVFKTIDRGLTWNRIYFDVRHRINSINCDNPDTLIGSWDSNSSTANTAYVMRSIDGGYHWDSIPFIPGRNLGLIKKFGELLYATTDTGYYKTNVSLVSVEKIQDSNFLINYFPNPFRNELHVNARESGLIQIYDFMGRKVYARNFEKDQSETLHLNLSSSIYYLNFSNESKSQTVKLIHMRD